MVRNQKMMNIFQVVRTVYKHHRCGDCRKLTLDEMTKCLVKNTIYFGPSGCLEMEKNTKTQLCNTCLRQAKINKKLIRIF